MSLVHPDSAHPPICTQNKNPLALGAVLIDSAIERATQALEALNRDDRSEAIHLCRILTALISSLQNSLVSGLESEVGENLDALYDYMIIRLSGAGEAGNEAAFAEVHALLGQIKQGWENLELPSGQ